MTGDTLNLPIGTTEGHSRAVLDDARARLPEARQRTTGHGVNAEAIAHRLALLDASFAAGRSKAEIARMDAIRARNAARHEIARVIIERMQG